MKRTKREQERKEAIEHLRTIIKPGDTVYTVLRHVSRSGMTRGIDVYILSADCNNKDDCECTYGRGDHGEVRKYHKPEPVWITSYVGKAIDQPQPEDYWRKSLGLKIGGCGMDMGFHVVSSLSDALYGKGYQCLGKGKCPSNYHANHRDTVPCEGTMVYNPDGPNTGERCWRDPEKREYVITLEPDGDKTTRCPKCKGKGRLPNPDGPERFDLVHTDGYALRHKWL